MSDTTLLLFMAAVLVVVAYIAMWVAYVLVRYERSQWWLRLLDPDSYPSIPWWEAFREAIRRRLVGLHADAGRVSAPTAKAGTPYEIVRKIGRGDLCDVFLGRRRGDRTESFILKIPTERGTDHLLHQEHDILQRLHAGEESDVYGKYFPQPIDAFRAHRRWITVRKDEKGFLDLTRIQQIYPQGVAPRHVAWMFNRTLEALGYVHQHDLVHGAVLPPHLMFHPETHGLQLVGWTHAVPIGKPIRLAPKQYKSWYPPSCHQREGAMPAVDLHLAARSMMWIAGESPGKTPRRLPMAIYRFLNRCLHPSWVTLGAWALHAQFRELLEEEFGPPSFCSLPIPGEHLVQGENDGHHLLV